MVQHGSAYLGFPFRGHDYILRESMKKIPKILDQITRVYENLGMHNRSKIQIETKLFMGFMMV